MTEKKSLPKEDEIKSDKSSKSYDYFADFNLDSLEISMESMMKGGVHFGHQKSRRNPKMDEYIFTVRKNINIIDLEKTAEKLEEAVEFIKEVKKNGRQILFVGTKKQSQDLIKSLAIRTEMPYVIERWLGGTFTNFKFIKGRASYLKDSQQKMEAGDFKKYTKFEQMKKKEELEKLEKKVGGIKNMTELPGALFAVDVKEDELAIKEARKMKIPIVALTDTNVNPSLVDYPIPANDDAISSIKLILSYICKTLISEEAPKKEKK